MKKYKLPASKKPVYEEIINHKKRETRDD